MLEVLEPARKDEERPSLALTCAATKKAPEATAPELDNIWKALDSLLVYALKSE